MSERMSPSEAVMWAVEKDPALRSDFCNLTLLDRAPDDRRLQAKIEHALVEMPRLAQRVVSAPLRLVPPEWRPDPTFELDYHLRHVALPEPGATRQLLDLAAGLCAPPLDRSRPLWEFTVVKGLEHGRAALLQKIHHTITDGVGGLRLSLSLVDTERDPQYGMHSLLRDAVADHPLTGDPVGRDSPIDVMRDALADATRAGLETAWRASSGLARVAIHPTVLTRALGSIRRQVLVAGAARSPLMAHHSLARRFDMLSVPLDRLHEVARVLGGSVNDAFVTGVTGGLGGYHERMGIPVDDLRMAMPVSMRGAGDAAANRFAPSRVLVPTGPKDPAQRFREVHRRLERIREEPALGAVEPLAALTAGLPTSVLVGLMHTQTRTIDFAASNLRGSPVPLYMGGARIDATYPMGPRAGCPLNVTVISYCGALCIGIHSDPAAITDPDAFVECLRESFDALLAPIPSA